MTDDKKPLRVKGVPNPKGTTWLKEVKLDAARNAVVNLREQQEKQEYERAKAQGLTVEQVVAKGKEDLGFPHAGDDNFEDLQPTIESSRRSVDEDEVADLKRKLKEAEAKVKAHESQETSQGSEGAALDNEAQKPLEKMNKAELQEVAERENVEVDENATNKELVEAISSARKETA
jgi:hypothetical protein